LRQLASTVGVWAAGCYVVARGLEIVTRGHVRLLVYRFVAQPVPEPTAAAARPAGTTQLRYIEGDDALATQFPRPASVIARRFSDGARCLAAVRDGRLIGFLWYQQDEYVEDEVRCVYRFDPNAAVWDFDVYIDPDFRFGRLFARLWEAAHRDLRARGYRWTLSRISAFNPASIASHARLGARRIGAALFVVAGPVQVSLASVAPFIHIGWRAEMRPTFFLKPE
jgi:GNAT superfamily N-acetyltransferase